MPAEAEFRLRLLPNGEFSMQSLSEGETFHPVIGARREAELLYLGQLAVPERCALPAAGPLVVWDVGLGAAGNAMHLMHCWRRQPGRDLHLVSFDLNDRALRFALEQRAGDGTLFPWLAGWDWAKTLAAHGFRLAAGGHELRWEWHLADFPDLLASPAAASLPRPELVFYDAYSPAKCWRMWRLEHWRRLRRQCGEACEIAFHSRATALRVTLLLAGFYVGYGAAIGGKEETTVAATRLSLLRKPLAADWLKSVGRSTSASPFAGESYRQAAISPRDFARLSRHPQFSLFGTDRW
jgi:hypothetical protein